MRTLVSEHHANRHMRCSSCHVAWPCAVFRKARREARITKQIVLERQSTPTEERAWQP